jgi:hypothetical protein
MVCEAMGVAPDQVAAARAIDGCDYVNGCPVITSAKHYRDVQRKRGFVDKGRH